MLARGYIRISAGPQLSYVCNNRREAAREACTASISKKRRLRRAWRQAIIWSKAGSAALRNPLHGWSWTHAGASERPCAAMLKL